MSSAPRKRQGSINVTVGSPTKVKDAGSFTNSFYVQYQVQTVAPDVKEFADFPNGVVSVGRRYSDFVWLSDVLHEMLPGCIIPSLPKKRVVGNFDQKLMEYRSRALELFLQHVSCHVDLGYCEYFYLFLNTDENAFKSLMSTTDSRMAKKMNSVSDSSYSLWNKYVNNAGKEQVVESTIEDFKIETMDKYVNSLDIALQNAVSNAKAIMEHSKANAEAFQELAGIWTTLGGIEGDKFGGTLSHVGEKVMPFARICDSHADRQGMTYREPLDEYVRIIHSVKKAINKRADKKKEYIRCLTSVDVAKTTYNKALEKAGTSQEKLKDLQGEEEKLNLALGVYELATHRLLRDFDDFQRSKIDDLKHLLANFINCQTDYNHDCINQWATVSAIVTDIDSNALKLTLVDPERDSRKSISYAYKFGGAIPTDLNVDDDDDDDAGETLHEDRASSITHEDMDGTVVAPARPASEGNEKEGSIVEGDDRVSNPFGRSSSVDYHGDDDIDPGVFTSVVNTVKRKGSLEA
jgi:hypothetical protein